MTTIVPKQGEWLESGPFSNPSCAFPPPFNSPLNVRGAHQVAQDFFPGLTIFCTIRRDLFFFFVFFIFFIFFIFIFFSYSVSPSFLSFLWQHLPLGFNSFPLWECQANWWPSRLGPLLWRTLGSAIFSLSLLPRHCHFFLSLALSAAQTGAWQTLPGARFSRLRLEGRKGWAWEGQNLRGERSFCRNSCATCFPSNSAVFT